MLEAGRFNADAAGHFATTHWSVVLASRDGEVETAGGALDTLCRTYWYPLYAYVRRQGYSPEDAQDLTQAFFERFLARDYLSGVDRQKGKFRSFLLASLNHFLSDQRDYARALKRGGGRTFVSIEGSEAEDRYRLEPVDYLSAEKIYERRWALTVLERALARVAADFEGQGKRDQFERIKDFLQGESDAGAYRKVAEGMGISEGALRVMAHRLRRRYAEYFREEIAQTVGSVGEVEEEIDHLMAALR